MILNKIGIIAVFLIFLFSGLYFGIGGLSRLKLDETVEELDRNKETLLKDTFNIKLNEITIKNKYDYLYELEANDLENFFPWAIQFSSFSALIITALSFGLLGALIAILKQIAFENLVIEEVKIWSLPLLGLLTGLVIYGLSYILPTALVKNGTELRPITLMFLCLLSGIYSNTFYLRLTKLFDKISI